MAGPEGGDNNGEEPIPEHGWIDRLVVQNFKSYRGTHTIGPFKRFVSIVGPNGSGKSNLMDAISFVLGVRTAQLRGSLGELLHTAAKSGARTTEGFVRLVFLTPDGGQVTFERAIVSSGAGPETRFHSRYKIDGRTVDWVSYNGKLESFRILVKARNFLVFQGDIESVAAMAPKDLTNWFETISGSAAMAEEYNELAARKNQAEDKMSLIFTKKKATSSEKRQKKVQKQEAEQHMKLLEELRMFKAQRCIWEVYHLDKDIEEAMEGIKKLEEEAGRASEEAAGVDEAIKEKEVEYVSHNRERLAADRRVKKLQAEADKGRPGLIQIQEEIVRVNRRIKAAGKEIEEKSASLKEKEEKIHRLEEELEDVKQRQEERRGASGAGARSLEMDEADLQEYYRIKNEVGAKTAKLQADKQVLQQQQEAERLPLAELEDEAQQLEGQVGLLREQKDQLERSREQMSIEVETVRSTLERKRQDKSEMGEAARRQAARKEHLLHKVDELQEELHELKVTKKFSERERQRVDAVETMKGLIPGVYGSLNELSKVTHRKYNMAMAVTMGKHMDCVLVNTKDTAKECIRHLKEHRIPPMTFLPLDNLNLKPLNESLRQLGGTAKLAIDLLQFEPAYQRGLLYACGNTVVCDTVEEAKRLAFGGEERLKVVTLDGTLIDRSGMITGGTHGGMEARAAIFDQHKVETMKQERDRYKEELRHMPSDREAHQQEQQLSGEVVRLAEKQKYTEAEIAASGKKIISRDKEIEQLTERHEGLLPRMEQLRENVSDRQKEIDRIQVRIDAVTDRLFSSFSKRMGVKSIREYEENQVKRAEERAQEDMRLATDIAKIENQLKYERSRHQEQDKVERLRSELKTAREGLRDLKERQAAAEASCKEVEDRLAKERRLAGEAKEAADAFNGEIRDMRKKLAKISGEAAKVKRSVDAKKSSIEQIESRREEAVQAAKVEMGADFAVDFDTLSHQHRATRSVAQREKMEREFRSQIDDLGGRLAKAAPNLKALEQYELIKEQEREQAVALDAARQEAREAKEAFYAVHQRRYDAFMASYDHVKAAIEDIYRDLTKSELHPFGGMAYLNLENSDEPFNHGIRYHAMPPTKRFRDMEQLSGGEKTVAALALLFAIHSFRPSPFFVLDEIDASLDATNVARVAKYIYHATRPSVQGSFQAIVISLKDVFFSNSDMLVGVARDFGEGCGRTFTYDLSAHGPPE